jgi:hypothetical protein
MLYLVLCHALVEYLVLALYGGSHTSRRVQRLYRLVTSAYVSIRQHAYVSKRQQTSANVSKRQHTSRHMSCVVSASIPRTATAVHLRFLVLLTSSGYSSCS